MSDSKHIYEMSGAKCYGYFDGLYLYTMGGKCTHYRSSEGDKYLYKMQGGVCEFYQEGKYIYEMKSGKCRWYFG